MNTTQITQWINDHWLLLSAATTTGLITLVTGKYLARSARRAGHAKVITALINIAAVMATSVQASGMWKFFGNTMGLPVGFRIVLFAFMEIGLLATGLRARANVEEGGDAGIDGVLVWVFALTSGVMSSTDASTTREALMRIVVAVVVSLLWTRDLMAAKRKARQAAEGRKTSGRIRWRITGERVFVWLRLADAVDTDVSAVDAGRRVARFLRKTDRERNGWRWPLTAKARAYRETMRMVRDALMRSGNPSAVYGQLATSAYADALGRLGIGPDRTEQTGPDRPDGPGEKPDQTDPGPDGPDGRSGTGSGLTVPERLGDWTNPDQTTGPDRADSQTAGLLADRTGRPDQSTADQTATDRTAGPANQTGPDRTAGPDTRTSGPNQTGPNRRTGRTGGRMQGSLDELEAACRTWATQNEINAAQMSRRNVMEACHGAGYSCSTERASEVQDLLDPKGAPALIGLDRTGPDQ